MNAPLANAAVINVNFDLRQLDFGEISQTITSTDGSTTLTVGAVNGIIAEFGPGLEIFRATAATDWTYTFRFSREVTLESYYVSKVDGSFDNGEYFEFIVGSGSAIDETLAQPPSVDTTYEFGNKLVIPKDTTFSIVNKNRGAFDAIYWRTLTVRADIVPEPETYALLLGFIALTSLAMRHRRH